MNQQLSARKRMGMKVPTIKDNCKLSLLVDTIAAFGCATFIPSAAKKPRTQRSDERIVAHVEKYHEELQLNPLRKISHFAIDNNIPVSSFSRQLKNPKFNHRVAVVPAATAAAATPTVAVATPPADPTTVATATAAAAVYPSTSATKGPTITSDVAVVNRRAKELFCKVTQNLYHQLFAGSKLKVPRPDPVKVNMVDAIATCKSHYWNPKTHPGVDVTTLIGFESQFISQHRETQCSFARLQSRHTSKKMQQEVEYGKVTDDYRMEEGRCIMAHPLYARCGYWNTEHGWNYGITDKTHISDKGIVDYARYTSRRLLKNETYRRYGAAGGPIQYFDVANNNLNPSSLSNGTTDDREFKITSGPAINATTIYSSKADGHRVSVRPRSDIKGYQLTDKQVRVLLKRSEAHREYAIKIQQSRFKCQLLVCCFQLPPEEGMPPTLANGKEDGIWEHFNTARMEFKKSTIDTWQRIDNKLTAWEIFLLEYWLMTGELVNDEPVAAHCDKSEGHVIETLFLTAKIDPDDRDCNANIARECAAQTGQVMIPFQDSAFLLEPGPEVLHANFQETTHLAERSRGRTNSSTTKHSRRRT